MAIITEAAPQTPALSQVAGQTMQPRQERRFPPLAIADRGAVRIGGQGPCFRPAIADAGKVRIGGQGPIFR